MKKKLWMAGMAVLVAGVAQANIVTVLDFNRLNPWGLTGNTLDVGGSESGFTIARSVGDSRLYTITYTGADFDGDSMNDTLTFGVRVDAVTGSTANHALAAYVTTNGATASIGSTIANVDLRLVNGTNSVDAWGVGEQMNDGTTLIYSVTNISSSVGIVEFNGFDQFSYAEVVNPAGTGHGFVVGSGSNLFGRVWGTGSSQSLGDTPSTLHITGDRMNSTPLNTPTYWGVRDVSWGMTVTVITEPATIGSMAIAVAPGGTNVVLSWPTVSNQTYGVQAKSNLLDGSWSSIITNIAGTGSAASVTNAVSTDAEFYQAYVEE